MELHFAIWVWAHDSDHPTGAQTGKIGTTGVSLDSATCRCLTMFDNNNSLCCRLDTMCDDITHAHEELDYACHAPRAATVCMSPSCVEVPTRCPHIIAAPPSTEGDDLTFRLVANTSSASFEVAAPVLARRTSRGCQCPCSSCLIRPPTPLIVAPHGLPTSPPAVPPSSAG